MEIKMPEGEHFTPEMLDKDEHPNDSKWRLEKSIGEFERMNLNCLGYVIHDLNKNWWIDLETGKIKERNIGEMLMLMVSELAEAMEGHRKNLMDDKIPHRTMFEVELADCIIRIMDVAGAFKLDLDGAIREKLEYNRTRADHQIEQRKLDNGKKY